VAVIEHASDLPHGRLLALDLGQARHGVAVCDEAGILASPLTTLRRAETRARDFAAIAALAAEERAVGVLVGMPASGGEDASAQARWVRRYAGRLAGALLIPVAFWDETLSTADAGRLMQGARAGMDAVAAALILQDFLEARRVRQGADMRRAEEAR
jgi:putative Holliday junction resolvase